MYKVNMGTIETMMVKLFLLDNYEGIRNPSKDISYYSSFTKICDDLETWFHIHGIESQVPLNTSKVMIQKMIETTFNVESSRKIRGDEVFYPIERKDDFVMYGVDEEFLIVDERKHTHDCECDGLIKCNCNIMNTSKESGCSIHLNVDNIIHSFINYYFFQKPHKEVSNQQMIESFKQFIQEQGCERVFKYCDDSTLKRLLGKIIGEYDCIIKTKRNGIHYSCKSRRIGVVP